MCRRPSTGSAADDLTAAGLEHVVSNAEHVGQEDLSWLSPDSLEQKRPARAHRRGAAPRGPRMPAAAPAPGLPAAPCTRTPPSSPWHGGLAGGASGPAPPPPLPEALGMLARLQPAGDRPTETSHLTTCATSDQRSTEKPELCSLGPASAPRERQLMSLRHCSASLRDVSQILLSSRHRSLRKWERRRLRAPLTISIHSGSRFT